MRHQYQQTVKAYLLDKEWYKVVDCLESVTNYWSYGRDWGTMPTYNTYMPTRTHLMDKPDMLDGEKDDLGYQMNLNRLSPYFYLNTLKGNKMMPQPAEKPKLDPHKQKFYKKWRRMSKPKMHASFSTINRPLEPQERPTFLQSILNYSSIFQ